MNIIKIQISQNFVDLREHLCQKNWNCVELGLQLLLIHKEHKKDANNF